MTKTGFPDKYRGIKYNVRRLYWSLTHQTRTEMAKLSRENV
jgi:hypothetical protein